MSDLPVSFDFGRSEPLIITSIYEKEPQDGVIPPTPDPLFVEPYGTDGILGTEDDDFRLALDSPAIDSGTNETFFPLPPTDLDDNPRILNGIVDLGAYEITGVHAKYGGGTGEPNDPYLIYTAEQMNEIGLHEEDQSKHFKLMADIDLSAYSGTVFNMIGVPAGRGGSGFAGVFDGNDHTISNFTYTSTYRGCVGIFNSIWGPNARINNLGLIDPNIDAEAGISVGPLAGRLDMGTITNCYVVGGKISGKKHVGGLVGANDGHVANCFSYCTIQAEEMVGGLVGRNDGIIMTSCSYADITGIIELGGLVGYNRGEIVNCYTRGEVVGQKYIGGLVGDNLILGHSKIVMQGIIRTCYSTTTVSGNEQIGGLIGLNGYDEIADSFWDIETSSQTTSQGGIGKTIADMQTAVTFLEVGWDFVDEKENGTEDIWWIDEGQDYPRLWWELSRDGSEGLVDN
jgi:hypothetical protein